MTVVEAGEHAGVLLESVKETRLPDGERDVILIAKEGLIHANLTVGTNVTEAKPLKANDQICSMGLILGSRGFVAKASQVLGLLGEKAVQNQQLIYPFFNGRDLTEHPRGIFVIDTMGWSDANLRTHYPEIYQHLLDTVYPERQNNRDRRLRDNWWLPRRSNEQVRTSIAGLSRYIATPETASHRFFVFLPIEIRPEHRLIVTGSSDAFHLGVLSSRVHVVWAIGTGGTLEDRPVYNKTIGFDPFPFPDCTEPQKQIIRDLGERLDAHRKRQQQLHSWLTLTDMYNVLKKLRGNEALTEQEQNIYTAGLIGILRELHDELDRAVFDAYGWRYDLTTEQILERVVALNAERRAEEASGLIRWLRPEYQAPNAVAVTRQLEGLIEAEPIAAARRKQAWPATLPDQVRAVKDSLRALPQQNPAQIAAGFRPASRTRIQEILETLTNLGQTRHSEGRYSI